MFLSVWQGNQLFPISYFLITITVYHRTQNPNSVPNDDYYIKETATTVLYPLSFDASSTAQKVAFSDVGQGHLSKGEI